MNHPDDQIINGSPVPTFVLDHDHTVTHWNRACEALTGLLAKNVVGTSNQWTAFYSQKRKLLADFIIDQDDEPAIQREYEGTVQKSALIDDAYEVETYLVIPASGAKWLSFTAAALRDPAGQVVGAIQTLQDITVIKRAEQREHSLNIKLAQTVSELQNSLELVKRNQHQLIRSEKMAALGGLVAGVAHEINTPVGIGVTAASLLEEKTSECARLFTSQTMKRSDLEAYFALALESSGMILANLGRASDLIQRFKQVAVDQTCEEINEICLKVCLENHIMSLHPVLKNGAHTVRLQCPENILLKSYAGALGQIVTILIMNSVLHGFEGLTNGVISLTVEAQADDVVLVYRDNGKGIAGEHLERIFEPFFTTKRNHGGTGLGLHILYNLVTQTLGGQIDLESEYGNGVIFRLLIPRISHPARIYSSTRKQLRAPRKVMMNITNDSNNSDDDLSFAEESPDAQAPMLKRVPWKLLIVDDEEEIHRITRMALKDFAFEGRGLSFVSAYSGAESRTLLQEHPDTAIVLLDVVMETEHAGLEVARYIRETLHNTMVRIILRTGRPGQAPERRVILDYDINDYKEKTELTVQKLTTSIITALRSHRDLHIIDRNRRGLLQIINASAQLFEIQSLRQFANGVLTQLLSILNYDESSLYFHDAGFSLPDKRNQFVVLAATGEFESFTDKQSSHLMSEEITDRLNQAVAAKSSLFFPDAYVGFFPTGSGRTGILYLNGDVQNMLDMDRDLIRLFSNNVSIAFKNLDLNFEIIETQKEVIYTLGEVVENHSNETANHVKRVAEVSWLLAMKAGLGEERADILRMASPMHDIGKVGVPESILNMPGKPTVEEFEKIKPHAAIGYGILRKSRREIMEAAAVIAHRHHERWDGAGYPDGIAGEDIHIYARITGLADVFDALSHSRVYKKPWKSSEVYDYISKERGKHFDPVLTDLFLQHFDEFLAINERFPA